jgi:hypothetical protein
LISFISFSLSKDFTADLQSGINAQTLLGDHIFGNDTERKVFSSCHNLHPRQISNFIEYRKTKPHLSSEKWGSGNQNISPPLKSNLRVLI